MRLPRSPERARPATLPDARAALGASTPAMPSSARASAPPPHMESREIRGGTTGARRGAVGIEIPKILLALENGVLLFLRYQWCGLPPVDLLISPAGANDSGEHWAYADETWSCGMERLDCGALLQRLVERSRRGLVIVQAA